MRDLSPKFARMAAMAGAALLLAGCGGDSDEAANDAGANALDSNLMLDAPGNDASAMEAAANATGPEPGPGPEPAPAANSGAEASNSADPLGDTSGGDTGGNTVESNVSAM